ncbi:hypothetical protein O7635_24330 [Asanoa sp. WMMD1127]|uniref:hypothetical protein n=1 Tax=Asanoa sp. WMMD1127 TaxID=3016107 RepID=UPI0024171CDF|nr:hypothetical protein [Asanoa sp. WMMD1127]MDG4824988.1 hypothetical protein [Asanoa sp. WMMD1127]
MRPTPTARAVNGTTGTVITLHGRPLTAIAFTIVANRMVAMDGIRDPVRVPC